jgi:hypothetical protein
MNKLYYDATSAHKLPNIFNKTLKLLLISAMFGSFVITSGCTKKNVPLQASNNKNSVAAVATNSSSSSQNNGTVASTSNNKKSTASQTVSNGRVVTGAQPSNVGTTKTQTFGTVKPASGSQTSSGKTVGGIKVQYGSHTYGCTTQAQYDAVMKKVKELTDAAKNQALPWEVTAYENGDRAANYPEGSDQHAGLTIIAKSASVFIKYTTRANCELFMRGSDLSASITSKESNPSDSRASSAYDVLYNGIGKCDADAQLDSAIFDTLGFNTLIVYGNGDASCLVSVDGHWWGVKDLHAYNISKLSHLTEPTR